LCGSASWRVSVPALRFTYVIVYTNGKTLPFFN
jgi:hypothetical protein